MLANGGGGLAPYVWTRAREREARRRTPPWGLRRGSAKEDSADDDDDDEGSDVDDDDVVGKMAAEKKQSHHASFLRQRYESGRLLVRRKPELGRRRHEVAIRGGLQQRAGETPAAHGAAQGAIQKTHGGLLTDGLHFVPSNAGQALAACVLVAVGILARYTILRPKRTRSNSSSTLASAAATGSSIADTLRACLYPVALQLGIIVSLSGWGLLQERIMTLPYRGSDGGVDEFFSDALFLVCANRLLTAVLTMLWLIRASIARRVTGLASRLRRRSDNGPSIHRVHSHLVAYPRDVPHPLAPLAPWSAIAVSSIANTAASSCQYQALRYISFPLQTLAKCAKTPPVMLWGFCLLGKRFPLWEIQLVIVVCAGCALFLFTGAVISTASRVAPMGGDDDGDAETRAVTLGIVLLAAYMLFDGFTSSYQGHIFTTYPNLTTGNMVLHSTTIAFAFSFVGLATSGSLAQGVGFATRHPSFASHVVWLSACAAASQFFIFETIRIYGALNFAVMMTTRQVVSVLLSCAVYRHRLSIGQWTSLLLVFGPLYLRAQWKADMRKSRHQQRNDAADYGGREGGEGVSNSLELAPLRTSSAAPEEENDDSPRVNNRNAMNGSPSVRVSLRGPANPFPMRTFRQSASFMTLEGSPRAMHAEGEPSPPPYVDNEESDGGGTDKRRACSAPVAVTKAVPRRHSRAPQG